MKHLCTVLPPWFTVGLVFVALFPFVGGILAATSELFIGKARSKTRLKRTLIITGSVLSVLGALIGAIQQSKDSYELWAVSTGGDNYCSLHFAFNTSKVLRFLISNNGNIPVYDVSLEVTDINRWQEIKAQHADFFGRPSFAMTDRVADTLSDWEKQTKVDVPVGNVRPDESRYVYDAPIPKDELQSYFVSIFARNGYIKQEILMRRTESGNWVYASRVWRGSVRAVNGKFAVTFLNEDVMPDFRHYYPKDIPWQTPVD